MHNYTALLCGWGAVLILAFSLSGCLTASEETEHAAHEAEPSTDVYEENRPDEPVLGIEQEEAIVVEIVEEQVVYKTVEGQDLHLLLRRPVFQQNGIMPGAIVFFHGGGWTGGGPQDLIPFAEHYAEAGWLGISVQYRPQGPVLAAEDAIDAINYIFGHAEELGIDRTNIIAGGGSAGGHLAMLTALADLPGSAAGNRPKALILFNPVTNTTGGFPVGYGRNQFTNDEEARAYSPYHQIRGDGPAVFIAHGLADRTVSVDNVRDFCRAYGDLGNVCELSLYENQAHAFFNYRNGNNPLYDQVVEHADAFLHNNGFRALK